MLEVCAISKNAIVGAVALGVGAAALAILAAIDYSLSPLRLFTLAVVSFGIWAFCDEMEMRRPLIRAGFVVFVLAIYARAETILNLNAEFSGRYYLLYAFALLGAMLFWSAAYLHRQRDLKIVGALGAVASLTPIAALLAGHVVLGAGAFVGIRSLLAASAGEPPGDLSVINGIDYAFSIWMFSTAWLLWSGRIRRGSSE